MREIKFRAWNWLRFLSEVEWKHKAISEFWLVCEIADGELQFWEEENITLQQFTGLLDKNGKEIYEGDILEDIYEKERWVMKFSDWLFWIPFHYLDSQRPNDTLIIWNVHENPELLTKE